MVMRMRMVRIVLSDDERMMIKRMRRRKVMLKMTTGGTIGDHV